MSYEIVEIDKHSKYIVTIHTDMKLKAFDSAEWQRRITDQITTVLKPERFTVAMIEAALARGLTTADLGQLLAHRSYIIFYKLVGELDLQQVEAARISLQKNIDAIRGKEAAPVVVVALLNSDVAVIKSAQTLMAQTTRIR